jgi:ATP-binding cassette, subfamily C (CFTR/MRP), member 2
MSSKTTDDSWQLMSHGEVIRSAPYQNLLADCEEFKDLVSAHKDTIGLSNLNSCKPTQKSKEVSIKETDGIHGSRYTESVKPSPERGKRNRGCRC